jgi:hypothetical protein
MRPKWPLCVDPDTTCRRRVVSSRCCHSHYYAKKAATDPAAALATPSPAVPRNTSMATVLPTTTSLLVTEHHQTPPRAAAAAKSDDDDIDVQAKKEDTINRQRDQLLLLPARVAKSYWGANYADKKNDDRLCSRIRVQMDGLDEQTFDLLKRTTTKVRRPRP